MRDRTTRCLITAQLKKDNPKKDNEPDVAYEEWIQSEVTAYYKKMEEIFWEEAKEEYKNLTEYVWKSSSEKIEYSDAISPFQDQKQMKQVNSEYIKIHYLSKP